MKSLSQLEQCVDLTTLDAQFQRACCGQSDYIRLNNGFGSSSGYDWIDTACTASTYNVSNTRSLIVVFAYFIYRLSLFTQSPILHLCLFLYYWAHLITLIKHYITLHAVSNAALGHLLAHYLALLTSWVLRFARRLHSG